MANPEHLKILKQGVEVWNKWRRENDRVEPDLSGIDLSGANLERIDFSNSNLEGCNLSNAKLDNAAIFLSDLSNSDLRNASLIDADLEETTLCGSNLSGADLAFAYLRLTACQDTKMDNCLLQSANLLMTNLSNADLSYANLRTARFDYTSMQYTNISRALIGGTAFCGVDLSNVIGIETIEDDYRPSFIDVTTIFRSKGKIPTSFLRKVGVPEVLITYIPHLVDENPIEFYSCFISFGEPDREFVDRLYADLQAKGIRTWYWHEDHAMGAKTWKEIHQKIWYYDKLMVVCSEEALARETVIKEIERALQRETREGIEILFPIRVDNYIFEWDHYLKAELTNRNVGDFRNWDTDNGKYQKSLKRLMKGLGKKDI